MDLSQILILLFAGLLAGIVSGSLGVGGGIVIVPVLVFLFGMSQHEAQGTSLFFMLPPIGILAAINYYKSGYVNVKFALFLIIAFFIGSYIGSVIAVGMPEKTIKKLFGVVMLFAGFKMIFGK
jgi:uncharacterized protein